MNANARTPTHPTTAANQPPTPHHHEPPFFIIGTGRCGTTLLNAILGAHPDIATGPETLFFARFDPALRFSDPLPDAAVNAYHAHATSDMYFNRLKLQPARLRDALDTGTRSARDLLLWFLREITGTRHPSPRFGEKTPGHQRYVGRINAVFPTAKFVHIHRDPRDVVPSLKRAGFMNRASTADFARYYRRVILRQQRWAEHFGHHRYLTIAYENLVHNLEQQLHAVCTFLDIDFYPAMLEHHAQHRDKPLYLDFEKSWKHTVEAPVDATRVGRYRKELPPRDIATIERTVGSQLMRSLGYQRDHTIEHKAAWLIADSLNDSAGRLKRFARRSVGLHPREHSTEPQIERPTHPA